jgi:hypothetical protein
MNSQMTFVHAQARQDDLSRAALAEWRREKRMQRSGTGAGRLRVISFPERAGRSERTAIPAPRF